MNEIKRLVHFRIYNRRAPANTNRFWNLLRYMLMRLASSASLVLKKTRMAESRMNLAALQQRDPYITDIVETASQVALYSFSSKVNEWVSIRGIAKVMGYFTNDAFS